jgi:hypothetical protein
VKEEKKEEKMEVKTEKKKEIDVFESWRKTQESYTKLDKTKYPEPTADEIDKQKVNITTKTQELLTAK